MFRLIRCNDLIVTIYLLGVRLLTVDGQILCLYATVHFSTVAFFIDYVIALSGMRSAVRDEGVEVQIS